MLLIASILLLTRANGYHSIIPSSIESALQQDWSLSSTKFDVASGSSIVAYDSEKEKVIIFGGEPHGLNVSESGWIDTQTDWKYTYIYDIKTDKLSKIEFNLLLQQAYTGFLTNYITTNAIIINSIIYFAVDEIAIKYDLTDLYAIENAPSLAPTLDIQDYDLLDPDQDAWYNGMGCLVKQDGDDDLFYVAGTGNKNVIICSIKMGGCLHGGISLHKHNMCTCAVIDDILYIIGGYYTNVTEYVNISTLYYADDPYQFTKHNNVYKGELHFNDKIENGGGRAIIKDDDNKLIYVLGGDNGHQREIYKMNITSQTMELLDIQLPEPGLNYSTAILSKSNGQIYAFRGMNGWGADTIAWSNSVYNTMDPTQSPSKQPSGTPSNSPTNNPTYKPSWSPTIKGDTRAPSIDPTMSPSNDPSQSPTTASPTTSSPTMNPTTLSPTSSPTAMPSANPTQNPSNDPSQSPTYPKPSNAPTNRPTKSPSNSPTTTEDNTPSSGSSIFLSKEVLEIILSGVGACLVCVCCIVIIGIYLVKRMKDKQASSNNVSLIQNEMRDEEIGQEEDKNEQYVEIEAVEPKKQKKKKKKKKRKDKDKNRDVSSDKKVSLVGMVSDEKIDELYEIYSVSRLQCMRKCQEMGFVDEFLDQLFAEFEQRKKRKN